MKRVNNTNVFVVATVLLIMIAVVGLMFSSEKKENATAKIGEGVAVQEIYNVLFLGKDTVSGLCDVMILASVNTGNGEISIMQIPRDTYFSYGNGNHNRINGAPHVLGVEPFSRELGNALGINIDLFLSLNTQTLAQLIDLMGGVDIDIPMDMDYDDPDQDLFIHLKKGRATLNGTSSLGFLRYRSGYVTGDLGRLDAQKLFLNAFINRLGEIKNPVTLYSITDLICSRSESNLKRQDLLAIGLKLSKVKSVSVIYCTAPGEAIQSEASGAWYYILSRPSMTELLGLRFGAKEKDFDVSNKFVDKRVKSFYDIYENRCAYRIYSASEIDNNQVNIN